MPSDSAPMTAVELGLVAEELAQLAASARIQRVHGRAPTGVTLELRAPGHTHHLVIVAEPPLTRMHLADARQERPERASEFVRQLRSALEGARLLRVESAPRDRVVRLVTERGALVAELTGHHGNLCFVDDDGIVRALLHPVHSERRTLRAGSRYAAPTARPGVRAPSDAAPRLGLDALPADGSRSRALAQHFDPLEAGKLHERARTELERRLRRSSKSLARRIEELSRDLEAARGAEGARRAAQGLLALGRPRERGHSTLEIVDYGHPDTPKIPVELDPALSIQENASRLFKRHKKLTRALPTIEARLAAAREARAAVEAARARLPALETSSEIEALTQELIASGQLSGRARGGPAPGPEAPRRREVPARALPYRSYRSGSGREILVGRGAASNDELSLRIARGSDAWFHAEGTSGSHVVLRLARGEDPDPQSLIDAATLAAHFSQGPKTGKVGVIWTRAARVRKPKGAGPGTVTATGTRALTVRLEPERVARLLGRADDAAPHARGRETV